LRKGREKALWWWSCGGRGGPVVDETAEMSVATAWRTLRGIEAMDMIRKGRVRRAGKGDVVAQVKFFSKLFGIVA
jgi:hypothetical protein